MTMMMLVTTLLRAALVTVIMLRMRSHRTAHLAVHTVVRVHMIVLLASLLALLVTHHKLISNQHESKAACECQAHIFTEGLSV